MRLPEQTEDKSEHSSDSSAFWEDIPQAGDLADTDEAGAKEDFLHPEKKLFR